MSPLLEKVRRMSAVAVVPAGMAAAFAFQAPAASAAPAAGANQAAPGSAASTATTAGTARLMAGSLREALTTGGDGQARRPPRRLLAYQWALRQKGHPYVYGGTGPGFDCSGLVMMAYRHAGIRLPRTTYGMLGSPKLVRVIHPRMG